MSRSRIVGYGIVLLGVALFGLFSFVRVGPTAAYTAAMRGYQNVAIVLWRPLALLGNADAQFGLGLSYAKGRGVAKDDAMATQWYEKAALNGLPDAQFNLGEHYRLGEGVPKDARLAIVWLQKAAEQNHHSAQHNLGRMLSDGSAGTQDYVRAMMWFRLAVANGSQSAKASMAYFAKVMTDAEIEEGMRLADEWLATRRRS